jgi:Leucine-rich repeat (LRR) protein
LPQGLQVLDVSYNKLSALQENLPQGVQKLYVSHNKLTALPANLPQGLLKLSVNDNKVTALPANLPQGLQELYVSYNMLTALPANLPQELQKLDVSLNSLTALPANLPQGLLKLYVSDTKLTALPANLPQGLLKLEVSYNNLTALPANLPQSLKRLVADKTGLSPETLLALMRTNTSITDLDVGEYGFTIESWHELDNEMTNNQNHPARVAKAAATLDLLTRFRFTASATTGELIERDPIPDPVAGQLPQQSIPAELHQVLAEHCPKGVLTVLAGMVDDPGQ